MFLNASPKLTSLSLSLPTKDLKMAAAANTSDNSAGTAGLSLTPTLPGSSGLSCGRIRFLCWGPN